MVSLQVAPDQLKQFVREVVETVVSENVSLQQLMDGKLVVDETEAARLLGLNPWQLRDVRRSGKITFTRIVGGRIRYTRDDLNAYLNQGRSGRRNRN